MRFPALVLVLLALPIAADPRPGLGLFDGYRTPAAILRGIILTESDGRPWAVGDDGLSEGAAQLNRRFHAERARKWGAFNPFSLQDAIRITSCLFQANLRGLLAAERCIDPDTWAARREDMAIAAHRQGVAGVQRNGMTMWYVERVRRNAGRP